MADGLSGEEQAIYFSKIRGFFDSYACSRVMERRKKMADEYISKAELYKQIAEKEELARNRYLDTPSTLPVPIFVNPSYERYMAQLNERTAFKHMVADFPPADVVQVAHSEWIYHMSFGVCKKCGYEYEWKGTDAKNYCPNCGAKMEE